MKYLILEIFRSLKNNLFIFISLVVLLFMSTGVYTLVTNISKNINSSFLTISAEGNLHDVVVNEKFPSTQKQTEFYEMLNNEYIDPDNGESIGFGLEKDSWYKYKAIDILTSPDEKIYKLIENTPNQPVNNVVISSGLPIQKSLDIASHFPTLLEMYYGYSIDYKNMFNYTETITFPYKATSKNNKGWTIDYNAETDAENVASVIALSEIMHNASYTTDGAAQLYDNFATLTKYNYLSTEWIDAYVKLARGSEAPVTILGPANRDVPPKIYGYDNYEDAIGDPQIVIEYTKGSSIIDTARSLNITDPSAYAITVHPAFANANGKTNVSDETWNKFIAMDGNQRASYLNDLANEGSKNIMNINGTKFLITGIGTSPDYIHPIFSNSFITPIFAEQAILFGNTSAYNRMVETERASPIEEYIVIKNTSSVSDEELVKEINDWCYHNMNWPSNILPAALATDTNNVLNISAARLVFADQLVVNISAISTALVIFLSILSIIIINVIIRKIISNLRMALGICKSNGIKTRQIFGAVMIIPILIALIGCIPGYLFGIVTQEIGLSFFSEFWSIPTSLVQFDFLYLLLTFVAPVVVMMLMVAWITYTTFRVNNVDLLKEGSEYKVNFLNRGIKAIFSKVGTMTNFRISFATNSLWKLILLTIMTASTMSTLTVLQTVENQFEISKAKTFENKDYSYMIDLATPTTQGGLHYPVSDSSWIVGKTVFDDENGNPIYLPDPNMLYEKYNVEPNRNEHSPLYAKYLELSNDLGTRKYDYNADYLAVDVGGKTEYFNNVFIAGGSAAVNSITDIQFNKYRIQSMSMLDHIFVGMNAWDIGVGLMPETTSQKFNNAQNKFLEFANDPANGFQAQYYIRKNVITNEYSFTKNPFSDPEANDLQLDPADTGLGATDGSISTLSKQFTDAIFEVYNSPLLHINETPEANNYIDFKITNNILFTNTNDQFYTYLQGTLKSGKSDNEMIDVVGINQKYGDDSLIKIYDQNGNDLIKVLDKYSKKSDIFPIIVNEVGASENGYKVGDVIELDISNTVDRYTKVAKNISTENIVKFEIVGIDQARYGYEYFTTQEYANEIIGLTSGNFNGANDQLLFNGILTDNERPSSLSVTFPLYAPSGIGIPSDRWNKEILIEKVFVYPELLEYVIEQAGLDKEAITAMPGDFKENVYNELVRVYTHNIYYSSLEDVSSTLINKTIFDQTLNTSTLFFNIIVGVVVPVTFLIVILIITLIVTDVKRLAAMLKALGMSDRNNSNSFIAIYIPVLLTAMAISIPISMLLFDFFKGYVFTSSNILLFGGISWVGLLVSILGVGLIFAISYFIAYYSMRKIDLIEELK